MKINCKDFCKDGFGLRAPVPYWVEEDRISIFFGKYTSPRFAEIYSVTLSINAFNCDGICSDWKISSYINKAVVKAGPMQTYSESGIVPSCFIRHDGKGYLFTIGFSDLNKHYFHAESGLIIFDKDMQIINHSIGPVLSRNYDDVYWAASPFVIENKKDKNYSMFYTSAYDTVTLNEGKIHHRYLIKKRISTDLERWYSMPPRNIINPKNSGEYAIARPAIIELRGKYIMFYSKRKTQYSDDYLTFVATSDNLEEWDSIDKPYRFLPAINHKDCECYAYPILSNENILIFFNVQGYGKEGAYLYSTTVDDMFDWIEINQPSKAS